MEMVSPAGGLQIFLKMNKELSLKIFDYEAYLETKIFYNKNIGENRCRKNT